MNPDTIKNYFDKPQVVADYAAAAENVGLWNSEKKIFFSKIGKEEKILELGCGAGRISLGLWENGYRDITATDFAPNMVDAAREIFARRNADIETQVCDATSPDFPDESFDAVIFGFNGLMQIPKSERRRKAVSEIFRILRRGGRFIFTTHDRDAPRNRDYWNAEKRQWATGSQQPSLDEFGDIFYEGDHGGIYIHSPARAEIESALTNAGFASIFSSARRDIAEEPPAVEDFSDDCIFWSARKR